MAKMKPLEHYARQVDDLPWSTVLAYAWAILATSALVMLVVPTAWRPAVRSSSLALAAALLVAKDLAQLPRVRLTLQDLRARHAGLLPQLAACLPPGLLGLARLDRALWGGFVKWLRRLPHPAPPEGLTFSVDQRSAYSALIAFGLVSILVELPIGAAILPLLVDDPAKVRLIHLIEGVAAAYSIVWLLGDRYLLRGASHVLTDTHLDLQIGARASARIPLAAIESSHPLPGTVPEWRTQHALRHADTVTITPFDKPNLVLCLASGAGCAITHHGVARDGIRQVFLYLDHPGQLLTALAARRSAP